MITKDPGIIKPPRTCSCGKPVVLTLIEVVHIDSNRIKRGPFSQFGDVTGTTKRLVLRPNYRFKRWVVECIECRYGDQQEEIFNEHLHN